jgi:MFS family permease
MQRTTPVTESALPSTVAVADLPTRSLAIPAIVKRNTVLLAVAQACVGIGNQMVTTLGALMAVALVGTPAVAGAATGIMGGCRLITAYPMGYIADHFGRRGALLLGLALAMVGSFLVGLGMARTSAPLFFLGLVVFGIGLNGVQQLRIAAADMYPPSRRAEGIGYVLTGSLLGVVGGPILIGIVDSRAAGLGLDPMALAWLLVPVILVPSMALVLFVRPDPREIAANLERYYPGYHVPRVSHDWRAEPTRWQDYFRHYPKLATYVTSYVLFGNMTMNMALNGVVLAHHGHDLPAISLSVAIHVVGMFGFSIPLGRLADMVGRRNVMLAGIVGAAIGGVLLPTAHEYWVATLGTFMVGLGWACVNVAGVALIADTTSPLERGRALGINDACGGLASVTMPVLAGPLVAVTGLHSLAVVSLTLMLVPLALLLRLREPSPGKYAHAEPSQ